MFSGDLFSVLDEPKSSKKEEVKANSEKEPIKSSSENQESKQEDCGLNLKSLEENVPQTDIHNIHTSESCLHEVAIPRGIPYTPLINDLSKPPAKEYPFTLDPFQTEAISCLENNHSVIVSAHTSAGKTVIAEYAVALSLKARQRVIYTTPIKALSNQKYRELLAEFVDVGLMTGDVTINPSASCLVMTTEILRSMLYRGSEVMREAAWVVFDEIHYMRDKERGVVWEESIILLPDNIHYVFLSATIPNARQFAEWISHVHKQPCHVVYTEYRPTPLQHYIYPAGGDGIHLVLDENRSFKEVNFNKAMKLLEKPAEGDWRGKKGGFKGTKGKSSCFSVVKMTMEKNLTPIIVFSFSKKECEGFALQLSKLDFNTAEDKKLVEVVFSNAIDALSDEDKKLPQLGTMLPLLCRGIGIHHSGLLPLLKEVVEILFSEGLIKVLCATETFAMGMNMPARTVLFTSARKFDGKEFRWISSGEYIQMSGRAGRRGLDDRGIVILMLDESFTPEDCKHILQGKPDPLNSAFHLTYTMILNMLRVEGIEPEFMLDRCFLQFQNTSHLPDLIGTLKTREGEVERMEVSEEVVTYCKVKQQLDHTTQQISSYLQKPQYILPFLQPGRLLRIVSDEIDFDWGVVVNIRKKANQTDKTTSSSAAYVIDILLHLSTPSSHCKDVNHIRPCSNGDKGTFQVVPVNLSAVTMVSSVCLYTPTNLVSEESRNSLLAVLKAVKEKFHNEIPLLDPVENMAINEPHFFTLVKKLKDLTIRLERSSVHKEENVTELVANYQKREALSQQIRQGRQELRTKKNLYQLDQLRRMKRVLRRLAYTSAEDVVQIKGRVACEITTADVLVICELLFNGTFSKLTSCDICCLLSCLTFQEKGTTNANLSESLTIAFKQLKEVAQNVGRISAEVGLQVDEEEYVDSFQSNMMPVVEAWCRGESFVNVCRMTTFFEGSIIRCIRRLEECLRQLWQAAKVMGNAQLEEKFSEGIKLIKRDIIFANSLYL